MGGDTSPEQQYALRWNDFQSSILSSFRHLRDEEDFVDVTLACDGCSFTAHKVVLSACSPYFRRLLKANPCQHPIVILRDVQQKDMENLLRFMYNGEVHIGQEQLADFLKTAQMLQVRGLADVETSQKIPAPEQKVSPNSTSLPWATDRSDALREGDLTSPPPKRAKSTEETGTYTPERGRSPSRGNGDTQESLLGQALEGGPTILTNAKGNNSESSLQAQSTGDDSSSDTQMSDHERDPITPKTEPSEYPMLDDHHPFSANGGLMDPGRTPTFPGALLNLPGLPGLLPGPSSMHGGADSFGDASRSGDVVNATIVTGARNILGRMTITTTAVTFPKKPQQQQEQHHQQPQQRQQSQQQQQQSLVQAVQVKYECPLCDQLLPSVNAARMHIDEHYPRDSPYCPVAECGKRFSHPNSVRNHMRTKHSRQWDIMKQIKWCI